MIIKTNKDLKAMINKIKPAPLISPRSVKENRIAKVKERSKKVSVNTKTTDVKTLPTKSRSGCSSCGRRRR